MYSAQRIRSSKELQGSQSIAIHPLNAWNSKIRKYQFFFFRYIFQRLEIILSALIGTDKTLVKLLFAKVIFLISSVV